MLRRLWENFEKRRIAVEKSEAHLAKIAEHLAASEARQSAWAERIELKLKQLDWIEIHLGRVEHQLALSHPRFASPLRLERFGRKIMSQNDEDGIIAEIFRRIGEGSRTFAEIAAGNGKENCTALLLRNGWRGLWVECDEENLRVMRQRWPEQIASGQLRIASDFVTRDNVNDIVARADLGDEIDLLVIDIDGNDHHVVNALNARPRVICAEYFAPRPPPDPWVMPYDESFRFTGLTDDFECGASLQGWDDLLTPRGYSLVGTSIAGVNCFFVRNDLVGDKFEAPFTAFNHYNPARYWYLTLSLKSAIWPGPPDATPPKREG